jgi:LytS/YehU family sensor histidine kinase
METPANLWNRYLFAITLFILSFFLMGPVAAGKVHKDNVLKQYEKMIVRSNEMNVAGYDLHPITFKLKQVTELLIQGRLERASMLLTDMDRELQVIKAKGPEHLQREKRLAWLEILGDFIQQLAIFVVISFMLLRSRLVKTCLSNHLKGIRPLFWFVGFFSAAAILGAVIGFIRYGQSSWSFMDLQILFIGIGGLLGGFWVGVLSGILNGALRWLIVPGPNVYGFVPIAVGVVAGILYHIKRNRSERNFKPLWAGFVIGLVHGFIMYVPIFQYLPIRSFVLTLLSLAIVECAVIGLFFAFAWYLIKEEKREGTERELYRTRLQFLRAQINPHFLFNTLNTIASVCGEENANRARELIVKLSTFFRRISKEESDLVSVADELEYIDTYLVIEKARFGERLQIEKNIQLSSEAYHELIPVLGLQPIVENALKHGLSKHSMGGKLTIRAYEKGSKLIFQVEDTGIGMDETKCQSLFSQNGLTASTHSKHVGIGLKNIRERFIRNFGRECHFTVKSVPNQGTEVTVTVPRSK